MVSSVRRDLLCPTSSLRHINTYLYTSKNNINIKQHLPNTSENTSTTRKISSNQPATNHQPQKLSIHFHLLSISAAAQYGTILGERRVLSQSVRDQDQLWCIGSGEQHEAFVKFVWSLLGKVFEGNILWKLYQFS